MAAPRPEPVYEEPKEGALHVLDLENFSLANGSINVSDDQLLTNVKANIRLPYPQVKMQGLQPDRVVLLGGGPSLNDSLPEIVQLVHGGAKLVTMNGSYHWALSHNLRPSAQIVLDARPSNARFVDPPVPHCRYLLASQCDPATFAAAAGRDIWIFHAAGPDSALRETLDTYYTKRWHGVVGGTTVFTRALALLRMVGYLRYDVFGVDSCWREDAHHAYTQEENAQDKRYIVEVTPPEATAGRRFTCSPWHMKQAEDFLQFLRINGHQFLLNMHGDGLLAYMLQTGAVDLTPTEET